MDPNQKTRPKAIFGLGYLAPILYGVSFNNLNTVCVRTLKISILTQFDTLNTMIDGPQSGNAPTAIFRLGYLNPVLYGVFLNNLNTFCVRTLKISILR